MSIKDEDKARHERRIFAEFASAADLRVDAGSVQSERPPNPDLSCTISGSRHYCELTEITDEDLAKNVNINLKTRETTGGPYSDDTPLLKAFSGKAAKARKSYPIFNGKLELLAYYDKQRPAYDLQPATKVQLYWLTQDMVLFGVWSRLWIYDTRNKKVLWSYSRE
ncbi:MAG: hypothetical protein ACREBG_05635 [Pyrinomonadaceae bacterium]